jgi:hypothetical protein
MTNKNLTLTQVADVLATIGYVISHEGEDIGSKDLYTYATELETSIASLLAKAKQKENEGA